MSSAAEKTYRSKMLHRSNDSGELDVFEAARYFSGGTEAVFGFHNGGAAAAAASISISAGYPHRQTSSGGGRRISFDGPPMRNSLLAHHHHHAQLVEKHHQAAPTMTAKEKKKPHKQPSSPGGRLASFLNSLFNQAASKKKKKSKSVKDGGSNGGADEDSPGGGGGGSRRKRRSSISHFRSASAAATTDSSSKLNAYSSSTGSSGFRTPPPAYSSGSVPAAKSLRELRNHSDHRHHVASSGTSLSWQSVIGHHHIKSTAASHQIIDAAHDPNHNNNCYKRNRGGLAWLDHLDEKLRFGDKKYQVKGSCNSKQFDLSEDDKETGKPESHPWNGNDNNDNNDNDGAESDSSSDLFELENYDLGHYSSDLPVYESTRVEGIDRGAPISGGPP